MTLRKLAGLLAAFGLTLGLIGSGVGASFFDSVTATQDISVGTFSCVISDGGGGVLGDYDAYGAHSVTYAPHAINSSAAGSAPLAFTVLNAGSIQARLTVTPPVVTNPPFSIIGNPFATVDLAPSGTQVYNTGVQWTELDNSNLGQTGSLTWTVNCNEVPAVRHWSAGSDTATTAAFPSTMALNESKGWPYVTVNDSTITLQSVRQLPLGGSCIEYRFDNNVPDQIRHTVNSGNNWNPLVTDGLWPSKCIGTASVPTQTITIPAGVTTFEVRSAFGAESDERFDWTRFNLLP